VANGGLLGVVANCFAAVSLLRSWDFVTAGAPAAAPEPAQA